MFCGGSKSTKGGPNPLADMDWGVQIRGGSKSAVTLASRVGVRKDGSCPSVSDRLDPPTFPTLCKDITRVMRSFSKSLAIGLPASRVGVHKDGSCPSVSDRLDPPTFPTLQRHYSSNLSFFFKSLAIGLPASRVGVRKDGSCPSVSDRLDPPTFPTLCKDITLVMRLFSKSLAIGHLASRVGAYLRRSDSVRVYWTTLVWTSLNGKKKCIKNLKSFNFH